LIGLELSDAGIIAAGGEPVRLLEVDGPDVESSGVALPDNGGLIIGNDAQRTARLKPRLYANRFWDELSAEPLRQPGLEGRNNAELAYAHVSKVWRNIKQHGNAVAIAVPGFFTREQLGLILGIAQELSMPVRGFATAPVAASSKPYPRHLLFHLDIHLHRIEVTFLEQGDHLVQKDSETLSGKGLSHLYAEWVKAVADEFVRTTRFDPFDQALYEQELYTRLQKGLRQLQVYPSVMFEVRVGKRTYQVTLTYDLFAQKSEPVFRETRQLIEEMAAKHGSPGAPLVIEVTDRVRRLPGYREEVHRIPGARIVELESGASALGIRALEHGFAAQRNDHGVAFLISRPWMAGQALEYRTASGRPRAPSRPTHVLYGDMAYPISGKPLVIGCGVEGEVGVRIEDQVAGVSPKHCTIQLSGEDVLLTDHSSNGTFVDGIRVFGGAAVLKLGQTIQVGTSAERLRLIICVQDDEA
jgi:hypothetical protein